MLGAAWMFHPFRHFRAGSGCWRFSFHPSRATWGEGFLSTLRSQGSRAIGGNPQESGNRPWGIRQFPFLSSNPLDESCRLALRTAPGFVFNHNAEPLSNSRIWRLCRLTLLWERAGCKETLTSLEFRKLELRVKLLIVGGSRIRVEIKNGYGNMEGMKISG